MGGTRGFRTHEGMLADVLVTAWILSIGMAVVAAAGHWEVALVLGVLFTLNIWLAVGTARSDARDMAMLRGVEEIVRLGCMCRDRQQLVKAGDRLAVLLGDRDYIGAREDWEQAKNGGDREC